MRRIIEDCLDHFGIEIMSSFKCADMSKQWVADQAEVAEGIKNFVAHKLIRKAKPLGVHDPIVVDHNRIFKRAPTRQAVSL